MYGWSWRAKLAAIVIQGGPGECWRSDPAKCFIDKDGYAHFTAADTTETLVHRAVLMAAGTVIPDGWEVDHIAGVCRYRDCGNPAHLEAVPKRENLRRAAEARVPKPLCIRGHSRADAYPGGSCRTCKAEDGQAKIAAAGFPGQVRDRQRRQRRQETARLASDGWSSSRIARHLGVDPSTIRRDLGRAR
jgi:hypothetical protein